ncbi:MAG: glycosyltransferase family 39 protein [bacterium]|nr:glycosyltransferase family 39 protein [bacterium]
MPDKLSRKTHLIIAAIACLTTLSTIAYIAMHSAPQLGNFDSIGHVRRSLHWYYVFTGHMPSNENFLSYTRLIGLGSGSLEGNIYPPLLHFAGGVVLLASSLVFPLNDPLSSIHILTFTIPFFFGALIYSSAMLARRFGTAGSIMAALICAASPCAFNYSRYYFLDIPLAAFTSLSLWMLSESNVFRSRKYSMLTALAIICGAFIKPTFLVFVAPALLIASIRLLASVFSSARPVIIFISWMAGLAGAAAGISHLVERNFNLYESISNTILIVAALCSLGTAFCFWHAYILCKKHIRNTLEGLTEPSPRQQFLNFMLCAGLTATIIALWYVPMGSLLAQGLHEVDHAATASFWYGCKYYLLSIARDHVVLPFLIPIFIGIFRAIWNKSLRLDAVAVISTIVISILVLAQHSGRLSRYTLPQLPMLAWLAACGITAFSPKISKALTAISACFWFMFISLWIPANIKFHHKDSLCDLLLTTMPTFYTEWGSTSDMPQDFQSFWFIPCTMRNIPPLIEHYGITPELWKVMEKYATPETSSLLFASDIPNPPSCIIKIYIDASQKNWHFSEFPYEFIGKPITEDSNYLRLAYPKGSLVIIMSEDSESFEWPGLTFLGIEYADESAWFKVFRREE